MASARSAILPGVILGVGLCAGAIRALAGSPSVALVPMPRELHVRPGFAALGRDWAICSTGEAEDDTTARLLSRDAAASCGWSWRTVADTRRPRIIELRAVAAPAGAPARFAEQGYRLRVERERVVIEGPSATGRFYGVQTLRQLLRAHPDGVIPCLDIVDYPALAWRGVSDDISRGQVSTIEDFKAIIRQLAYYKINLYQLYIEDMFLFEGSSTSGRPRGALTRGELEQLVAEGRRQHVVVSPIFETLAHQERLLSLKDHRHLAVDEAEARGGLPRGTRREEVIRSLRGLFSRFVWAPPAETAAPAAFSARNPHALAFVQSLVDEIAGVTRGPFFHVGGDEWQPPGMTEGTVMAAGEGYRAYGRYLGRVAAHLRERYGCRAMVYGDVILQHPEAARDLPRDVVIVDWHYDPQDSFPSLRELHRQGFRDVLVSPGLWTWRTFYPNYARGFRNIAAFAQAGKKAGALGCVAASWEDDGAENLRQNNWAGYAFAAAAAWETDAPAREPFLRRFVAVHYGSDAPELARAVRLLGWQEFDGIGWTGRLYHRALAVRPRPERSLERMDALAADMRQVDRDLAAAAGTVRFNPDQLAAARHCALRYLYIAERERCLDAAGRLIEGRTGGQPAPAERERIAREFERLEVTSNALGDEFARLWLGHNRPPGLAENQARLARQGAMLRRLRDLAQRGALRVDDSFAHLQALGGGAEPPELEGARR